MACGVEWRGARGEQPRQNRDVLPRLRSYVEWVVLPERIRELLSFATERVSFYRERRKIYAPHRIDAAADLGSLPLMRKADLREHFPNGLVAEGLNVNAMLESGKPVVRYVVGDVGRRVDEECDCAVGEWPVLEVHGRLKDMLGLDGKWVTTRQLDDAVSAVMGIDFYRCSQTGPRELSFRVVLAEGHADPTAALVSAAKALPGVETVKVKVVLRLDPEPSLKFRLTENLVQPTPELW